MIMYNNHNKYIIDCINTKYIADDCHNGKRYYTLGDRFLCWTDSWNGRWIVTDQLCITGAVRLVSGSNNEDIIRNPGWFVSNGNAFDYTRNVFVTDCGGNKVVIFTIYVRYIYFNHML